MISTPDISDNAQVLFYTKYSNILQACLNMFSKWCSDMFSAYQISAFLNSSRNNGDKILVTAPKFRLDDLCPSRIAQRSSLGLKTAPALVRTNGGRQY